MEQISGIPGIYYLFFLSCPRFQNLLQKKSLPGVMHPSALTKVTEKFQVELTWEFTQGEALA